MMAPEGETAAVRRFVRAQLSEEPDLSKLTLGILKKRYLIKAGRDVLTSEVKKLLKQAVEEELLKMQDSDQGDGERLTIEPRNKRKRKVSNERVSGGSEDELKAKKPRKMTSRSLPESEESEDEERNKSGSNKEKDEALESGGSRHSSSDDSADDERQNDSKKMENGSPKSEGGKSSDSEESEGEADAKSEKDDQSSKSSESSDHDEQKATEKKSRESDSDSSLSSLDDSKSEKQEQKAEKKKSSGKENGNTKSQPSEAGERAINRLKHYITLCGARKNYKKMFEGCKSVKSKVALLKKELEDLGIDGTPTIKKCKKVRKNREQAQELAALDVNNIITSQGRPKRRGAWQEQPDPVASKYQHALNSASDSDEEHDARRGRRKVIEWTNLRGVISDDGESD